MDPSGSAVAVWTAWLKKRSLEIGLSNDSVGSAKIKLDYL
jgi:hypothetical protein